MCALILISAHSLQILLCYGCDEISLPLYLNLKSTKLEAELLLFQYGLVLKLDQYSKVFYQLKIKISSIVLCNHGVFNNLQMELNFFKVSGTYLLFSITLHLTFKISPYTFWKYQKFLYEKFPITRLFQP